MTDDVWRRDEIESPCIKICMIHPETGLCTGCHRTRAEIAGWTRMSPEERREVMSDLPARAAAKRPRRGGRAGRLARDG